MLMRRLPLLIVLSLCGLFAAGLLREHPDGTMDPPPLIAYPAPALDLPVLALDKHHKESLVGDPKFTLADFSGRWVLINFFASWCVPCAAENNDLKELAATTDSARLAVLGIGYKDKPQELTAWLAKYGNAYAEVGLDSDGRCGIDWGITGVPESFLVDPAGRVVWHMAGPLDHDMVERGIRARINVDARK